MGKRLKGREKCPYKGDCRDCFRHWQCIEDCWARQALRISRLKDKLDDDEFYLDERGMSRLELKGWEAWIDSLDWLVPQPIQVSKTVAELVYEAHEEAGYFYREVVAPATKRGIGEQASSSNPHHRGGSETRVLRGVINGEVILSSGNRVPARIVITDEYAVIEPISYGYAAYVVDSKDISSKVVDLNATEHIRVIHNKKGIEFLKEFEK